MKIYIVLMVTVVVLFAGCKKEELPPLKCYTVNFGFMPFGGTGPIDSVSIFMQRADVANGQSLNTIVKNPGFSFNTQFCGVFKYRIKIFCSSPNPKYLFSATASGTTFISTGPIYDGMVIEGNYVYEN